MIHRSSSQRPAAASATSASSQSHASEGTAAPDFRSSTKSAADETVPRLASPEVADDAFEFEEPEGAEAEAPRLSTKQEAETRPAPEREDSTPRVGSETAATPRPACPVHNPEPVLLPRPLRSDEIEHIDGYVIDQTPIGRGGFAHVYDIISSGPPRVMKINDEFPKLSAEDTARELENHGLAESLDVPTAKLHDTGFVDGCGYLVLERLGPSIDHAPTVSPEVSAELTVQALRNAERIHATGLAHGDVSARNLLYADVLRDPTSPSVAETRNLRLIDFGVLGAPDEPGADVDEEAARTIAGDIASAADNGVQARWFTRDAREGIDLRYERGERTPEPTMAELFPDASHRAVVERALRGEYQQASDLIRDLLPFTRPGFRDGED